MAEGYIEKLTNYLKKNLSKGYTMESLKWALINQGYSRSEVIKAIKITNEELAREAPELKEKPKITVQREPILQEIEPETEKFSDKFKNFWKNLKEIFKS